MLIINPQDNKIVLPMHSIQEKFLFKANNKKELEEFIEDYLKDLQIYSNKTFPNKTQRNFALDTYRKVLIGDYFNIDTFTDYPVFHCHKGRAYFSKHKSLVLAKETGLFSYNHLEQNPHFILISNNAKTENLEKEVEKLKEENGHILELLETTFGHMSGTLGKITKKLPTQGGTRRMKKKGRKTLRRFHRR